jgi:hypothetical protein
MTHVLLQMQREASQLYHHDDELPVTLLSSKKGKTGSEEPGGRCGV